MNQHQPGLPLDERPRAIPSAPVPAESTRAASQQRASLRQNRPETDSALIDVEQRGRLAQTAYRQPIVCPYDAGPFVYGSGNVAVSLPSGTTLTAEYSLMPGGLLIVRGLLRVGASGVPADPDEWMLRLPDVIPGLDRGAGVWAARDDSTGARAAGGLIFHEDPAYRRYVVPILGGGPSLQLVGNLAPWVWAVDDVFTWTMTMTTI